MARRFDVAAYRTRTGQSQSQLADDLGVTSRTIRRWELAEVDPSPMATKLLQDHKAKFDAADNHQTDDDTPDTAAQGTPQGPRRRAAVLPSLP